MAAPTTIHDLPDDMLHEILGRAFDDGFPTVSTSLPPEGAHRNLRSVCRRWRDVADFARLSSARVWVHTPALADVDAVRARHPAALKTLHLACRPGAHSTDVARAAASLVAGSADLRRGLECLEMRTCCLPSLAPAVATIAACTSLTKLWLMYAAHDNECVVPDNNMLASLSRLPLLESLALGHNVDAHPLPASALLAPLPALPDAPRLTCLTLRMAGNFVPVGSDAALGRLRKLELFHPAPVQELVDAEDPFRLRAAFGAGTWHPRRLTGLKELRVAFRPLHAHGGSLRPPRHGSRPGSEWLALARQITSLHVLVESDGYTRPSTGIVAGLGVLSALRDLRVQACLHDAPRPGQLEVAPITSVLAKHLTRLESSCVSTPVIVAQFTALVHLALTSVTDKPPLYLRSLLARESLKTLQLHVDPVWDPFCVNLAQLFDLGHGWPVLECLSLRGMLLEWDTARLDFVPTAIGFADRARELLPALVKVTIQEPSFRGARPDRVSVEMCRRHVVPALLGLGAGGG